MSVPHRYPPAAPLGGPPRAPSQGGGRDAQSVCERVIGAVSILWCVPVAQMRGASRRARTTRARQMAMYLIHVGFGVSLRQIGVAFRRDRSTVGHACRRIEDERDDPEFDRRLDVIERLIREEGGEAHV